MTTLLTAPRVDDDATRRQFFGGAVLLLLTAGCGRDAPPAAAPDAAAGFPVTIDHAFGTTTIPSAPERVLALGDKDADIAAALGLPLVGIPKYSYSAEGLSPWLVGNSVGRRSRYSTLSTARPWSKSPPWSPT